MSGLNKIRGSTQIQPKTVPASAMEEQVFASDGSVFVDKENHTELTDGIRTQFLLDHMPVVGSEHVYLRGLLRIDGYTIEGRMITFDTAPGASGATATIHDDLVVSYRKLIT